ncbi:SDR family NAD(P)-dependent oxidoreductase [Pandoraea sp. PE-S2T-3]|uniref:SDR family NAD(P)-dependent oxidoreductase n=1 Tax=Pandoraea sp. PE-S2T-3 TaxID=1986993 RepID=UPI001595BB9F|nr:SDR family oxidoreductase [Pandoraea sp. PE-S2T-3]
MGNSVIDQRNVVVTGGARGLGAAIVKQFSATGANVSVLDLTSPELPPLGALSNEGSIVWYRTDVTKEREVRNSVREILGTHGPIDVLINNVGGAVWPNLDVSMRSLDIPTWEHTFQLNVHGAFYCSHHVIPYMTRSGNASIVNISSVNALMALGHPAYSASKAALSAMTRAIAVEYGPQGIRCNGVIVGTMNTKAWATRLNCYPNLLEDIASAYPLRRIATPDEIASVVLFLCAPGSSFISGTDIVVDGGLTAGREDLANRLMPDFCGPNVDNEFS